MSNTVTVSLEAAGDLIYQLVVKGLTFTAEQRGDNMVITLTGGY